MASARYSIRAGRTGGTVLIVAMWIVLVLAGLVLVFGRSVRVEAAASANHLAGAQAEAIARAALQFVLAQVDGTDGIDLPDDTVSYEAVPVGGGFFWLLKPDLSDDRTYAFGIGDEASRLSLNAATNDMLLRLPTMTAELAAAIVDWRDPDGTVTPDGAESEYYLLLGDPYYCKDGPFEAIEELLLVHGAGAELLFGEDRNRNGVLDPNEDDADDLDPPDNRDGHLDRGLLPYLTVHSREPNVDRNGEARVNVNDVNAQGLSDILRSVVPGDRFFRVMDRVRRGRPFRNIIDFYYRTGLEAEEFEEIADRLTTRRERMVIGLVNVNTAPREVLLCLPGLEESDVDALIAARNAADADLSNLAWVAQVLPQEKAGAVDLMTTRSFQFSADIVAVSGDGRAFRRRWALVDTLTTPPRVLCWKDLTHLGWPLAPEILTALRQGSPASSGRSLNGGRKR